MLLQFNDIFSHRFYAFLLGNKRSKRRRKQRNKTHFQGSYIHGTNWRCHILRSASNQTHALKSKQKQQRESFSMIFGSKSAWLRVHLNTYRAQTSRRSFVSLWPETKQTSPAVCAALCYTSTPSGTSVTPIYSRLGQAYRGWQGPECLDARWMLKIRWSWR